MAGKTVVVEMELEKECKTCKRFKGVTEEDKKSMQTVYIDNTALEALENPEKITLTIAVAG
jgi:hypothetical protein